MDDPCFGNDRAHTIAVALMSPHDHLQRGGVDKRATSQVDDQQPVRPDVGIGAHDRIFEFFRIGDVELAEDMQNDNRIEIFADECRPMIGNS